MGGVGTDKDSAEERIMRCEGKVNIKFQQMHMNMGCLY